MDEKTRKLQELLQSVHAAIAALDELTFLMHTVYRSPAAVEAQRVTQDAIRRAESGTTASAARSLPPTLPQAEPGPWHKG